MNYKKRNIIGIASFVVIILVMLNFNFFLEILNYKILGIKFIGIKGDELFLSELSEIELTKSELVEYITDNLNQIDSALQNVLSIRGEIGAKQNRMEDALERNEEEKFNIKEILSSIEDIDFAEKTIEYVTASTMYTASLQASSKIMQPSLIDYLR